MYDNPCVDVHTNNVWALNHDCFHQPCSTVNLTLLHVLQRKGIHGLIVLLKKGSEKNYSSARSVNTIDPDIREILIFTFMPGFEFATYMI